MTILLPDPYPGELLFGVLTRYRARMGITSHQMMQEVFQGRLFTLSRRLPVQLSLLVDGLPSWQNYSPEELAKNHSLLRYYTAFQSRERTESTLQRMCGTGVGLPAHMGLTMSEISEKAQLLLCPDCVAENTAKYGEPYWHTVHQAPGVWYCPHHPETLLLRTSAKTSSKATASSMATPLEVVIETDQGVSSAELTGQAKHILQYISRSVLLLLSQDIHVKDDLWASKKYKEKLAEFGCLLLRADIDHVKLESLVTGAVPEYILKLLGYKNPERFRRILNNLALSGVKNSHTLHHLIFTYILKIDLERFFIEEPRKFEFVHDFGEGPWPCRNPMQNLNCPGYIEKFEYRNKSQFLFKCPECGFTYLRTRLNTKKRLSVYNYGETWYAELQRLIDTTSLTKSQVAKLMGISATTVVKLANNLEANKWGNPPYIQVILNRAARKAERRRELRTIYRRKIIEAMHENPDILRSDTSDEGFRKASWWLRRFDGEWFEENGPVKRKSKKPSSVIDIEWPAIDEESAKKVYETAKSLISKDKEAKRVRRITKKLLSQHIKSHYTSLYYGLMPMTRQAIDISVESTYTFQIRRLKCIAENLKIEDKYVSFVTFLYLGKVYKNYQSDQMMTQARGIYETYISQISSRE